MRSLDERFCSLFRSNAVPPRFESLIPVARGNEPGVHTRNDLVVPIDHTVSNYVEVMHPQYVAVVDVSSALVISPPKWYFAVKGTMNKHAMYGCAVGAWAQTQTVNRLLRIVASEL